MLELESGSREDQQSAKHCIRQSLKAADTKGNMNTIKQISSNIIKPCYINSIRRSCAQWQSKKKASLTSFVSVHQKRGISSTSAVFEDTPNVFNVDKETFEAEVLQAKVPIVLDCYADWCGPCKRLTPIITESVEAQDGKVRLAKLDTDNQPELAQALGIQSLPTVFTVHNGKAVDQFIGLLGEEEVEAFVQKAASLGEE